MDFINYVSKNMKKEDMILLYRVNDIKIELLDLIYDFINHLNTLIGDTYMGDEISTTEIKKQHFEWCWNSVISSFKEEKIYFTDDKELFDYLFTFYNESFYYENKENDIIENLDNFWKNILTYDKLKTMSEYESLLDLYKIFKKSFTVS